MDALICLENSYIRSLMAKIDASSRGGNTTITRHLKSLYNYIETMLRLWTTNVQTYDHIPLINVNKLLHYGIFIHWYATEEESTSPVSYTHLDVYKRQEYIDANLVLRIPFDRECCHIFGGIFH